MAEDGGTSTSPGLPAWYLEKRREVERLLEVAYANGWRDDSKGRVSTLSPSGKFELEVVQYRTSPEPMGWNYSRGMVNRLSDGAVIADVKRNYGHFPHAWVLQGNREFLICGEDYQGYSVVDLMSPKINIYIPPEAERGRGFCWVSLTPSPGGKLLLVSGCYWAASYELRLYDLTKATDVPLPILGYLDYLYGDPYEDAIIVGGKWIDAERIELTYDFESADGAKTARGVETIEITKLPEHVRSGHRA